MASKVCEEVLVCTDCFETVNRAEASSLIERKCFDPPGHEGGIKVRVHLTGEGELEPEIRPMPKAYFRGLFTMCSKSGCKRDNCTYAHCVREKKAWNVEKFGIPLLISESTIPSVKDILSKARERLRARQQLQKQKIEPELEPTDTSQVPRPNIPRDGAQITEQLQQPASPLPARQPPTTVSEAAPAHSVPYPHSYASAAAPPLDRMPTAAVQHSLPAPSSPPLPLPHYRPRQEPLATPAPAPAYTHGAMKQKYPRSTIFQEPLTIENYDVKFHQLLLSEENAHAVLLKERCDGNYPLFLYQARQKPAELKFSANPYHKRFGYFKGMSGDQVSYATQSASKARIEFGGRQVSCDILQENNFHTEERLYIAFDGEGIEMLKEGCQVTKSSMLSPPLPVQFKLKYVYFRWLKEAIQNLPKDIIERILPYDTSFADVEKLDAVHFEQYDKLCCDDQKEALQVIASSPATGPPVLISGPFGTGKTRVLAIAAHYFFHQSVQRGTALRILVCTQQNNSADAYLDMYNDLTTEKEDLTIIRLVPQNAFRRRDLEHYFKSVKEFKHDIERNSYRYRQKVLIVTTCATARQIADSSLQSFFTHLFLDEGAQMREPEAVAPFSMVSRKTKIVIAGDKYQVGPAMLVLGEKPQQYGLAVSLLERLYDLYQRLGDVTKPYCAHLCTNFRCHRKILSLAQQVTYSKMPLKCGSDSIAHPEAEFPLLFVCSSLDADVESTESNVNKEEAEIALKEASRFFVSWPKSLWGQSNMSQMCFLSPCRGQVTTARQLIKTLPPRVKNVRKVPTYMIQGQEFRALFVSTSEPTKPNGETRDPTKSISDPFVFITALTRAQSLVVAVGNPYLLLKREKHMVAKYGDRGHCWSLFLKACLENNSISVHQSVRVTQSTEQELAKLAEQVNHSLSNLSLPKQSLREIQFPVKQAATSGVKHLLPDTPPAESVQPPNENLSGSLSFNLEGEYKFWKELGKGAFGVVIHVEQKISKQQLAIKIVKLRSEDQKIVEREVQALAKLKHPNIVEYYHSWRERAPANWKQKHIWRHLPSSESVSYASPQAGDSTSQSKASGPSATSSSDASSPSSASAAPDDKSTSLDSVVTFADCSSEKSLHPSVAQPSPERPMCLCILTELCQEETLEKWLEDHIKDRNRKDVTDWFSGILGAVKHIHSKKLIHRDLKPSNIFFSRPPEGEARKIKVGDFGLVTTSQVIAVATASPHKHSEGVGTSFYMSPEQRAGKPYSQEVDIYALGVIYFEMNFPLGSKMERGKVLTDLQGGKYPAKFRQEMTHQAEMIEKMLKEDPSERASADDIAISTSLKNLRKTLNKKRDAVVPRF